MRIFWGRIALTALLITGAIGYFTVTSQARPVQHFQDMFCGTGGITICVSGTCESNNPIMPSWCPGSGGGKIFPI
jgi:hypothetical protein